MFYGFPQSSREWLETKRCRVEEAIKVVEKECQGNNMCEVEVSSKNLVESFDDPCPDVRY